MILVFDPTASVKSVLLSSSLSQSLSSLSAWLALSFPWPLLATCQRREPLQSTLTNKLRLSEHLDSEWRFHSVRTLSRIEAMLKFSWNTTANSRVIRLLSLAMLIQQIWQNPWPNNSFDKVYQYRKAGCCYIQVDVYIQECFKTINLIIKSESGAA